MKIRTIRDVNIENKRVFLRVDFNVSIKDGYIEDDFKIKAVLETIKYLLEKKAKIIIATHFGRPEGNVVPEFSLKIISKRLEELLGVKVGFISDCIGEKVKEVVHSLESGEILMLENLRFHKEEDENDETFASELALLADIYVNDAFAVAHRENASVSAITKFIPSYAGFLMEKEYNILSDVYDNPKKPLVIVMGGSKILTKVKLIKRFLDKADHILVGGVIANVILNAKGISIGKSKLDDGVIAEFASLDLSSPKLHMPIDLVVAKEISENAETRIVATGNVVADDIILDIGPLSVDYFSNIIKDANIIIWNGPLGYFEMNKFAKGTNNFASALCNNKAYRIVGGGESIVALAQKGELEDIDFVSTGGGAMLGLLAGDPMPGIINLLVN
ncbi:MAG: phosphoglycerate kinase [Patescibacteria group bacterium]